MTTSDSTYPGAVTGVVVGDDGSRRALEAIEYAAEEAARRDTTLHVVRTWNIKTAVRPEGVDKNMVPSTQEFHDATLAATRQRASEIAERLGVRADVIVLHGAATKALLDLSRTAAVIVVGDRGVGGFAGRFIGSVADTVVREASCPVIVVRRPQQA